MKNPQIARWRSTISQRGDKIWKHDMKGEGVSYLKFALLRFIDRLDEIKTETDAIQGLNWKENLYIMSINCL